MTVVREAATLRRTGVVVAAPVAVDAEMLFAVCERSAAVSDQFARGDESALAVFGFVSSGGSEAAVAVSHIGATAVRARPDIATMLGSDVVDAIRVDAFVSADDGPLAVRAEVALIRIARDIADAFAGLVCDDVGAVYDPQELDRLVAAGRPRALSFSFEVACAQRAADLFDDDEPRVVGHEWPDLNDVVWPSDCLPDVVLDIASLFIVTGRHVPIVTAARIAVVASLGGGRPVVVFAPNLTARDARVLRAVGVIVSTSTSELELALGAASQGRKLEHLVANTPLTRDEIALFSATGIGVAEARAFFERRALEIATISARDRDSAQPAIVRLDDVVAPQSLPLRIARFAFGDVVTDAYHLDVARAHPLLLALIGRRTVVRELLDEPVRAIVVLESIGSTVRTRHADEMTIAMLAELSAENVSVAQDDAGATFDARSLLRLAIARVGRENSWEERVALSTIGTNIAGAR